MSTKSLWQRFFPSGTANTPELSVYPCQVDMHSHLLPGLDDGVSSLDETLECLQQLSAWGVQKVITTPHISRDWYPNTVEGIQQGLAQVRDLITEHNLPLTIDAAAEYLLDDFFVELLKTGDLLSFGEKRYLLVETGWASAPLQLADILFRIQTRGYVPVLAHPERYSYYHRDRESLAMLREAGCLFQLNSMSLNGRYGIHVAQQARYLLEQHWVDFLGSDLHRARDLKTMIKPLARKDMELLQEQPLQNDTLLS